MNVNFEKYLELQNSILNGLDRRLLTSFTDGLRRLKENGATLWVAGNGGASSTASHVVADFNKTVMGFGSTPLKTVAITDLTALTTAYSNDVDFSESICGPLNSLAGPNDGILLLSVSGTSPNILRTLDVAKKKRITSFSIFGSKGSEAAKESDYSLIIDSEDYQIVENIQLILIHWITKVL
jgi:D-sedoheptulose 7-phosphate isomerase